MEDNQAIARLLAAMTAFDAGDPRRIQHFIKVHSLARTIALLEGVDPETPLCIGGGGPGPRHRHLSL